MFQFYRKVGTHSINCLMRVPPVCGLLALIGLGILSAPLYAEEECSVAKSNGDCTLTIDRRNPLAPPTIQMYPHKTLTVKIKDPYYFERYFLDYTSGQLALSPDVASAVLGGLLTPLKASEAEFRSNALDDDAKAKLGKDFGKPKPKPVPPTGCTREEVGQLPFGLTMDQLDTYYRKCFKEFAVSAQDLYQKLEPWIAPDSHPQSLEPRPSADSTIKPLDQSPQYPTKDPEYPHPTNKQIDTFLRGLKISEVAVREFALVASIAGAVKAATPTTVPPPMCNPDNSLCDPNNLLPELQNLAALADPVAKDLYGYADRIKNLLPPAVNAAERDCADRKKKADEMDSGENTCVYLFTLSDPLMNKTDPRNSKLVTRQVTYAVDALNLAQNTADSIPDPKKKNTIVSVTVFYGDSKWEASAGTLFSTLAVRSFSVNPIITGGAVTDKQVGASPLYPTVVPFAAANYRLTGDWKKPKWRMATYWTFAAGINPNTLTADFATGPSISWRGLMFSGLWHLGHDTRLTQGLYKGESLGTGYSGSATTGTYWRFDRVAIGISVRVPSLTGR